MEPGSFDCSLRRAINGWPSCRLKFECVHRGDTVNFMDFFPHAGYPAHAALNLQQASGCLLVLGPLNTTCGHDHAGIAGIYGIFEVNGSIGNCGVSVEMSRVLQYMSYSLNSLKGGYIGHYIGNYYRGY